MNQRFIYNRLQKQLHWYVYYIDLEEEKEMNGKEKVKTSAIFEGWVAEKMKIISTSLIGNSTLHFY